MVRLGIHVRGLIDHMLRWGFWVRGPLARRARCARCARRMRVADRHHAALELRKVAEGVFDLVKPGLHGGLLLLGGGDAVGETVHVGVGSAQIGDEI